MLKKLKALILDLVSKQVKDISNVNFSHPNSKIKDVLLSNDILIKEETNVLKVLFDKYDSDKCVLHNYNYLYAVLFTKIKYTSKHIMEVGTYKGASLRSWKEYFINADIYGIDIDPDTVFEEQRIHTMIADQNIMESMNEVNRKWPQGYDVVIDDGWHQPEASVYTMIAFIPQLKKGGIYILEDIDQKYRIFYENLAQIFHSSGYYAEYLDLPSYVPSTTSEYKYGVLVIENI
jgi:predicted O-methyltransferase YrrM